MADVVYIAGVGNDVAQVMAGYAWLRSQHHSASEVLLICDPEDDVRVTRLRKRLEAVLTALKAQVKLVNAGAKLQLDEEARMLQKSGKPVFGNLTGGEKGTMIAVYQLVSEVKGTSFLLDAHGDGLMVRTVTADEIISEAIVDTRLATLNTHLQLYLEGQRIDQNGITLSNLQEQWLTWFGLARDQFLDSVFRVDGFLYAGIMRGTILNLLWIDEQLPGHPKPHAQFHTQTDLRSFEHRIREIGGDLARGYVPQTPNQVFRERQEGFRGRLAVLSDRESARVAREPGRPWQRPELPELKTSRLTLAVLLGAQPMPCLHELFREENNGIDRLILFQGESPLVEATAGRIATLLRDIRPSLEVVVVPIHSQDDAGIREAVTHVMSRSEEVHLNVNGGTKTMLMAMLQAIQKVKERCTQLTYLQLRDGKIRDLWSGTIYKPSSVNLTLQQILALHGVELVCKTRPDPPVDPELAELARKAADPYDDTRRYKQKNGWNIEIDEFVNMWCTRFPELAKSIIKRSGSHRVTNSGLAREYYVYTEIKNRIAEGAFVLMGCDLYPMRWNTLLGKDERIIWNVKASEFVHKSPDILIMQGDRLVIIEVKPSIKTAIEDHQEHFDNTLFGEYLGRGSKTAIIAQFPARNPKWPTPDVIPMQDGIKQRCFVLRDSRPADKIYSFASEFMNKMELSAN